MFRTVQFDQRIVAAAAFSDLDPRLVRRFRVAGESAGDETWAFRFGLARRERGDEWRPTVTGLLMAAREPTTRWLPNAFLRAEAYRGRAAGSEGEEGGRRIAAQDIRGPLDAQVAEACRFVLRNARAAAGTGGGGAPPYDFTAVFEAVVNAVAHRDYSIYEPAIRLRLFSDRLELDSPGEPPRETPVEWLAYRQVSRNQTITSLLAKCPVPAEFPDLATERETLMDWRGRGVGPILERSEEHSGRTPEYELLDGSLRLTIYAASRERAGSFRPPLHDEERDSALTATDAGPGAARLANTHPLRLGAEKKCDR